MICFISINSFNMINTDSLQIKSILFLSLLLMMVFNACDLRDVKPVQTQEDVELNEAIENTNGQNNSLPVNLFVNYEERPEYPGGDSALRKYIATTVKYPKEALDAGASGRVFVNFTITKDGRVLDPKIARSCGYTILDNEALRVVSQMPKWKPGKHQGQNVNVSYTVPITFNCQ